MTLSETPEILVCEVHFNGTWAYLKTKLPPMTQLALRESLSYQDKSVITANRFRRYQVEPTVCLYDSQMHRFPTGLLPRVATVLKSHNFRLNPTRQITGYKVPNPSFPSWLFPHQEEIIKLALSVKRVICESPTGSGKTVAATYFLANLMSLLRPDTGRPQLIMTVPTVDLLKKTVDYLNKSLGEEVGSVSGQGKKYCRVTVGVIKSLAIKAKDDPAFFRDVIGIVYDEAHLAASNTYRTFSNACINSDFRLGLTGTAMREKNDDLEMEALIGPILYMVKESTLYKEDTAVIIKPDYICLPVPDPKLVYSGAIPMGYDAQGKHTYTYKTPNQKPSRDEVYTKCIVENPYRNGLIIKLIKKFLSSKKRVGNALVLVEHIAHGLILADLATKAGIDMPFIHGSSSVKDRDNYTKKLVEGTQDVLCASSIFNMGTDIPRLEFLVIGSGGAASTRIIQQFGRTTRQAKGVGKTRAIVIDFQDLEEYYLHYNFKRRSQAIEARYPGSMQVLELKEVLKIL